MTSLSTLDQVSRHRIGILGYGREGRSAVAAIRRHRPDADLTVLVESGEVPSDLPVVSGPFDERLRAFDVLLRSPGVPDEHPALIECRKYGVEIINPASIWFAERAGDMPVVGVTGSKGKSTTAALLGHLLEVQGQRVLLAGNIGVPLLDHLETPADIAVVELSSYQLADLRGELSLGLITRLFPEHLDWHGSAQRYFACKLRIAELLNGRPLLINATDPVLEEATRGAEGRIMANRTPCVHRVDDALMYEGRRLTRSDSLSLIGRHNLDNAALALQAGIELGYSPHALAEALAGFRPLPHRLEPVAAGNGVRWINDSISTSPHATLAALEALKPAPVVLIVGGKDRPADWQPVIDWCRGNKLRGLITLPDNGAVIGERFERELGATAVPIRPVDDLEQAVTLADELSECGSVVLLSPGAPSFPRFRDFEDRGRQFTTLAKSLNTKHLTPNT